MWPLYKSDLSRLYKNHIDPGLWNQKKRSEFNRICNFDSDASSSISFSDDGAHELNIRHDFFFKSEVPSQYDFTSAYAVFSAISAIYSCF